MRYLSVCSGIEAASVAWEPLGWTPAAFSEIDPFARAVLAHHFPDVPCHGDFTTIGADDYGAVDLLVGGTPCQSFSVAGLRGGMDDERGNLSLEFLKLAQRKRPRWLVWENVPGVLSSNDGRDFGSIIGGMVELGYGVAYRVLDAQYFGVPQRRRRVFVVGYFGDARCAAAVLFERASLSGHPTPSRKTRKDVAGTLGARTSAGGGLGTDFELDGGQTAVCATGDVAHALTSEGHDASEDGSGRGQPIIAGTLTSNMVGAGGGADDNSAQGNHLVVASPITGRPYADRGPDENLIANTLVGYSGRNQLESNYVATERDVIAFSPNASGDQTTLGATVEQSPTVKTTTPIAIAFSNYTGEETEVASTVDTRAGDGPRRNQEVTVIAFSSKDYGGDALEERSPTLRSMNETAGNQNGGGQIAVAFSFDPMQCTSPTYRGLPKPLTEPVHTLHASGPPGIMDFGVRRLMPVECERLQGFPDGWTAVPDPRRGGKPAADQPRYHALGNSMAVPVMRWLGERIAAVDAITSLPDVASA